MYTKFLMYGFTQIKEKNQHLQYDYVFRGIDT